MCETLEVEDYPFGGSNMSLAFWFNSFGMLDNFLLIGFQSGTQDYLQAQERILKSQINRDFGPDFCSKKGNMCSFRITPDRKRPGSFNSAAMIVANTSLNPLKRPPVTSVRPDMNSKEADQAFREAAIKYQDCVSDAAEELSPSREEAPVVAEAAVQSCASLRRHLYKVASASLNRYLRDATLELLDKHVLSEAKLVIVRARTKRSKR